MIIGASRQPTSRGHEGLTDNGASRKNRRDFARATRLHFGRTNRSSYRCTIAAQSVCARSIRSLAHAPDNGSIIPCIVLFYRRSHARRSMYTAMRDHDANPSASSTPNDDFSSEQNLDLALAEASALAAELSGDVGPSERRPEGTNLFEAPSHTGENGPQDVATDVLDRELAELDLAVSETAGQLGDAAKSSESGKPSRPVPDFMAEFTEPSAARAAEPGRCHRSSSPLAAASMPAAAGPTESSPVQTSTKERNSKATTAEVGPADASASRGIVGHVPPAPARMQTADQSGFDAPPESDALPESATGGGRQWVREMTLMLAERVVGVLESVNRPFDWVNPAVKQALGWFAIATLATSVLVATAALVF